MFDGSHYPIEENIEKTKELVKIAHAMGLSLEAEVGSIGGEEDGVVGIPFVTYFLIRRGDIAAECKEAEQEDTEDDQFSDDGNRSSGFGLLHPFAEYIDESQKESAE
mgnify:CR=1 FL=1